MKLTSLYKAWNGVRGRARLYHPHVPLTNIRILWGGSDSVRKVVEYRWHVVWHFSVDLVRKNSAVLLSLDIQSRWLYTCCM